MLHANAMCDIAYVTQFPFSVPSTTLTHSLVYKYLYSVPRSLELRLLLLLFPSSHLSSLSSPLLVVRATLHPDAPAALEL